MFQTGVPWRDKDLRLLIYGQPPEWSEAAYKYHHAHEVYPGETSGPSYVEWERDPKTVMRLVQTGVQQRTDPDEHFRQMMNPSNRGGVWLQCQDDPRAEFNRMRSQVRHDRGPRRAQADAMSRMIAHAAEQAGKPLRQNQLLVAADMANKGDCLKLLDKLVQRGAFTRSTTLHGVTRQTRYLCALVVSVEEAEAIALDCRREVREEITERRRSPRTSKNGQSRNGQSPTGSLVMKKDEENRAYLRAIHAERRAEIESDRAADRRDRLRRQREREREQPVFDNDELFREWLALSERERASQLALAGPTDAELDALFAEPNDSDKQFRHAG